MKRGRGFSLLEIVLALGLVSFSMLAIFALGAQGQKTSRESRMESVAALLAGSVTSSLRASSAWETNIADYTGGRTLAQIANGSMETSTNYYDLNLERITDPAGPDRQFALITKIAPISAATLVSADADVAATLAGLSAAANTVFLSIEISYPAQAPEANRSKRSFASIITRTSRN